MSASLEEVLARWRAATEEWKASSVAWRERAEKAESDRAELQVRLRDFAATWHVANGHEGHIDRCHWSTCEGLLWGQITTGDMLMEIGGDPEFRANVTDCYR